MSPPRGGSEGNRYQRIIARIFETHYRPGDTVVRFSRPEIDQAADDLGLERIKNVGDLLYSFRFRAVLPESLRSLAPEGLAWAIRAEGRSQYAFVAVRDVNFVPNLSLAETKVPDATPGIITMYAAADEQALLTKLRYNRLIDIFTGVTAHSLQNRLRTTVEGIGQVETDEIYVGIDRSGRHYVFPVQAKGGNDRLGITQIQQDIALCAERFPHLICIPIAAQFIRADLIALLAFETTEQGVAISSEKHYRLVPPEDVTWADLDLYRQRPD